MSSGRPDHGLSVAEATQVLLLLMPRLIGRVKRTPVPERLRSFSLTPRHQWLLSHLVFEGPMVVNELARRLEVAPTTASLMVADLSQQGILDRQEDGTDRRRTIVSIADEHRAAIDDWLAAGGRAWSKALERLTPAERLLVVDTLQTYQEEADRSE